MRTGILIFSFILYIIFCNNAYVAGKEYFAVVSNRLLRPGKPYRVAIKYRGFESEKIIQIGLKNTNFSEYKNVTVNGDGDKTVEFLVSIRIMLMQKINDLPVLHDKTDSKNQFLCC